MSASRKKAILTVAIVVVGCVLAVFFTPGPVGVINSCLFGFLYGLNHRGAFNVESE